MDNRSVSRRFYKVKDLRLSIALIVIWSLLAGILFTYVTKEVGARIQHGVISFLVVFLGYVFIVVLFTLFFTHRFIGPFERLKMELRLILAGNYHRRLCVRVSDDFYIKSFIFEINKLLDVFEKKRFDKELFRKNIDSELLHLISLVEKDGVPKEKLRETFLAFHEKLEFMLKSARK